MNLYEKNDRIEVIEPVRSGNGKTTIVKAGRQGIVLSSQPPQCEGGDVYIRLDGENKKRWLPEKSIKKIFAS